MYRRALVNHYMNAWSLLPMCDHLHVAEIEQTGVVEIGRMDNRRIILVAGIDPYAYKGHPEKSNWIGFRAVKPPAASDDPSTARH